jgi:hypothetical protein
MQVPPDSKPAPSEPDEAQPQQQDTNLICPNCNSAVRVGELLCGTCGFLLSAGGRTQRLDIEAEIAHHREIPTGEVIVANQRPIIFEIEGTQLILPNAEIITVGRSSGIPSEAAPDVDLSAYDAEEHGVSRLHIRIRRKGILLYVADLGSTNGTHLNGRRLIPHGERLLRDSDELSLSRMRIRVRF